MLLILLFLFQSFFVALFSMELGSSFSHNAGIYLLPNDEITFSMSTGKCWRKNQEDQAVCFPYNQGKCNSFNFAIYDGHGGPFVSESLAHPKTGLLATIFKANSPLSTHMISKTFQLYDEYLAKQEDNGTQTKAGSTAAICIVDGDARKLFIAHCGDSEALLIDLKTGASIYGTADHNPSQSTELFRILSLGGAVYKNRVNGTLAVSRSFGDYEYVGYDSIKEEPKNQKLVIPDPEIFEYPLTGDGVIGLLFSDGFSNFFASDSTKVNFYEKLTEVALLLIKNGRLKNLSKDLILLMNGTKRMDEIIKDVNENIKNFDKFASSSTAERSQDNVSLITFEVKQREKSTKFWDF